MPFDKKISMLNKLSGKTKFSMASCEVYSANLIYLGFNPKGLCLSSTVLRSVRLAEKKPKRYFSLEYLLFRPYTSQLISRFWYKGPSPSWICQFCRFGKMSHTRPEPISMHFQIYDTRVGVQTINRRNLVPLMKTFTQLE